MNSALGRRRTAGAVIAVAVVALASCSTTTENGGTEAGTGDGTFPVLIESALGEAEIPESPERVVTLGQGSAETAIALGRTPVGVERYDWGSDETGYLPWVHQAITETGEELPEQFTGGEDIDFPAIVELAPDVILAPWSGITQEQFDILNDIAPTVAYPGLAWSTDWDEQIELIGRALGMSDEAAALITDIEDRFAEAAASRPEYADVTFSYVYTTGPGTLGVFLPDEQRVAMVSRLGLTVDPVVETFPETEGTDSALIGLEQADQLAESDLVFTFYSDAETREQIEGQPLYAAIPAVSRDSLVASDENPFVTASSMINPLTVPWTIDRYLPLIDDAISRIG
ncbi:MULTISPECIES: iron-siderophore ABC transporter substrate-binding protein [Actinoalloteichus]|uniref:ABC-type Fe3+-hydroxamate transport system, periplasmic component n=1 Tax=Actinoalloteichus fjordicus TaxID=1612552 RepID=A0AAC9PSF2_9PSEU|nr:MULTISPECIES: iron-siderophore ABC transporter substrate-binding protein [Actinoalloteichus]APU14945.1 ABC-type Fe3+-hydroxamate transport system, periplasmic component [Actinoalloteichus fjordicus]APU21015.1 ABC-type Fe3+-hydroxamate transport system, periplasmic component [Actinoalloteichus sp. GBA129-24]